MNLVGLHPAECYRWFMEFSCDAYDWVMVFNTFGMGMFAYPGVTTKPYITTSKYLMDMSDLPTGKEKPDEGQVTTEKWNLVFDGLFTAFLQRHEQKLQELADSDTARYGRIYRYTLSPYRRTGEKTLEKRLSKAEPFLEELERRSPPGRPLEAEEVPEWPQ